MEIKICEVCHGNGYIKTAGLNDKLQNVIKQCKNCMSQGEIKVYDIKELVQEAREKGEM